MPSVATLDAPCRAWRSLAGGMNLVCTAIEPISVRPRGSGDPGAENSAKELGPRFRGDERNWEAIQAQLISL